MTAWRAVPRRLDGSVVFVPVYVAGCALVFSPNLSTRVAGFFCCLAGTAGVGVGLDAWLPSLGVLLVLIALVVASLALVAAEAGGRPPPGPLPGVWPRVRDDPKTPAQRAAQARLAGIRSLGRHAARAHGLRVGSATVCG